MIMPTNINSSLLEEYKYHTVFLNRNPVWDYKLYNGNLCLIAYEIEGKFDYKDYYVDGEELLEYLTQENILYSTANLVDEDSSLIVSSYIIENNNLMLSTGNSYD